MNSRTVLRRCVTCRKLLDRKKLFKVTRDHQGGVVLKGGMGRSAYICPDETCLEDAFRRKRLQKSLRCQVPSYVLEELRKILNSCTKPASEAT